MEVASNCYESILTEDFKEHFHLVQDPRIQRRQLYPLMEILFLSVAAVVAGADGPSEIEDFGRQKIDWLRRFYPFSEGIPSHDTIGRVFSLIKPVEFQRCFLSWIKTLASGTLREGELQHICIDGKTLCGSGDGTDDSDPLHLVSAWSRQHAISLGQVATEAKSNEIKVIPQLIDSLELQDSIVTIDAMGCQRAIVERIIDGNGDYILAVKRNQRKLYTAIEDFFVQAHESDFVGMKCRRRGTSEKGHGRQDDRFYTVAPLPESMKSFQDSWKGLTAIGQAITISEDNGKHTEEARYYILSLAPKVGVFADCVRGHWAIENTLHWSLDVTFDEDASQIHNRIAAENFAFLRRFTLSLLKQDTSKGSLKGKRKKAGWNTDFLEKLLGL